MAHHRVEIDAVEQPAQLFAIERHDRRLATRPAKPVFGQGFQYKHEP